MTVGQPQGAAPNRPIEGKNFRHPIIDQEDFA